jgi:hypothetical protein
MADLLALILALLLGFSIGPSTPSRMATPPSHSASLRFTATHPIALRGRGFRAGERVRLTVFAGRKIGRQKLTTPGGAFVANFPSLRVDRCKGAAATARGNEGSVAAAKLPLPACLPERSGGLPGRIP